MTAGDSSPPSSASVAGRSRVTLQIIADRLSVSTATVSLALRDSPLVAEATRQRVREIAREMGYSYNRSAAALRTDRTNIIGVGFHDITNPYFAELLSAIEATIADFGRSLLLGTYAEDLQRQERVLNSLAEYRPDGMILCSAGGSTVTATPSAETERPASAGRRSTVSAGAAVGIFAATLAIEPFSLLVEEHRSRHLHLDDAVRHGHVKRLAHAVAAADYAAKSAQDTLEERAWQYSHLTSLLQALRG